MSRAAYFYGDFISWLFSFCFQSSWPFSRCPASPSKFRISFQFLFLTRRMKSEQTAEAIEDGANSDARIQGFHYSDSWGRTSVLSFKSNHRADKRESRWQSPWHQTHLAHTTRLCIYSNCLSVCLSLWLCLRVQHYTEDLGRPRHSPQCFECKGSKYITKTDGGTIPAAPLVQYQQMKFKRQKEKKIQIKWKKRRWNGTSLCRNPICIVKRHMGYRLSPLFHWFLLVIPYLSVPRLNSLK